MTKISYTPRFLTSLSPTDNANNIEAYSKSLRWAIENRDIRNVALTGPYGSGKSSILKTFSKNASNKFLEISLATFKESIEPKDDKGSTNNLKNDPKAVRRKTQQHQLIELSILQQIFYKVDPNEIPYSRFKRISSIDRSSLNIQVFYAFLCLFGATIIFRPNFFARISWWEQFYTTYADGLFLLALVCIFPILLYFTRFTIKVLKNSRLNKFKISAAEIELSNADSSILNKHIDEILYFFERTDYDVVTIEDLDRFNDPEIFTKLREINNLINDSKQVGRKVTFIYAVKDDMFSDNARSKFFDFLFLLSL